MHCLNCNSEVSNKYCHYCGQKTSTHRFSLKHFLLHDLVHGVFHLDKGFFFTVKELFTRPGHSIREYVQGKRSVHFNYFTFILFIITIGHILNGFSEVHIADLTSSQNKAFMTNFEKFATNYPKTVALIQIPILAFFSFLFFKRSKQNYTENLVLNLYKLSGELIISTVFTVITIFYKNTAVLPILLSITTLLILIYSIWFYFQYFSVYNYTKVGLIFRSVVTTLLLQIAIAFVTAIVIGIQIGLKQAAMDPK